MMYKTLFAAGLASLISFGAAAAGYDVELARSYAKLFEPATGAKVGKALHCMMPDKMVKQLQSGKQIVPLDVRTPNEFGMFSMTLPNSMRIPVNEVFLQKNLDRIPRDKMVVVVCKSGARAMAVTTALRHLGFNNVYLLKGGMMALAKHLGPKQANPPVKVSAR